MLKFLNGPAANQVLCCSRAPHFLRVTSKDVDGTEVFDALDQLDDHAADDERIVVYVKAEGHGTFHYDGRDKHGKRFGRWEQCADYRLYETQPDDAVLRNNRAWRKWAEAEINKEAAS